MEIVRFAGLIYRSTKIPASHVALLSSIQVNDRADVALLGASGFSLMSSPAPRSGLSRSDLVLWPTADQRVHPGMSATDESGHCGNRVAGGLCRVGPGNFTLSPSQIPDVNLSIHPARVTE